MGTGGPARRRKPTREWSRQCVVREVQKATNDAALAARFAIDGASATPRTGAYEDDDPLDALLDEIELSGLAPRKAARAASGTVPRQAAGARRGRRRPSSPNARAEAKREAEERARARRRAGARPRRTPPSANAPTPRMAQRARARCRGGGSTRRPESSATLRRCAPSRRAQTVPVPSGTRSHARGGERAVSACARRRPHAGGDVAGRR